MHQLEQTWLASSAWSRDEREPGIERERALAQPSRSGSLTLAPPRPLSGAALSDQDNTTRWQFTYSKSVKFVDVYAHHDEYGLWVQENVVYHSPHNLGKAKGGKAYRAGQALHDPPGRPVPWSVEGGEGAQVAYNYLGQGSWGQGEVWVRQGDQWVRQPKVISDL